MPNKLKLAGIQELGHEELFDLSEFSLGGGHRHDLMGLDEPVLRIGWFFVLTAGFPCRKRALLLPVPIRLHY